MLLVDNLPMKPLFIRNLIEKSIHTSSLFVTLQMKPFAVPNICDILWTVASQFSTLISTQATITPNWDNCMAISLPIPRPAPTT